MSNSPDVAAAGSDKSPETSLSEAQLSAFWAGIIANGDAAKRMARQFVPKQDAEDVVSTASILFLESFQRAKNPAPVPIEEEEFRRRFLVIVRNHALDCVRDSDAGDRPVHTHWGVETEPTVGGRKTADRPLDHVFARNDTGNYDAPAEAQMREQDNVDALEQILRERVDKLPRMQRLAVSETFFDQRKRAEVAARHGISVKTYDCHLQAAFKTLREELWVDADDAYEVDRSRWYDRIEELSDRYDDALGRRLAEQWVEITRLAGEAIKLLSEAAKREGEGRSHSSEGAA